MKEGRAKKEITFVLPPGSYRLFELPVMRYRLSSIEEVTGGSADQQGVDFDLTVKETGHALFYNEKINDRGTSDNCLVINEILP